MIQPPITPRELEILKAFEQLERSQPKIGAPIRIHLKPKSGAKEWR